ncbi:DAR GTPase 2, mitochondrial isoform X2 [Mercurialis annua]|uniref:DAR GTPase 2, mitochondrial isoform X2 n=1 Tax=Mercurialis annua TaxID=3986 RepID=UPI00215F3555|nr:DAR GTPase 2, mitochondrial isoform X2 [Mercurialis annua]
MSIRGSSKNSYIKMLFREIGNKLKKAARNREQGWYTSHMAAASRAIAERIPLVDFVIEVRDARLPLSSECQLLINYSDSSRRIVVMNKMDLANRSQLKEWISYFEERNCVSYALNSHNTDNVKQFLNFLQAQIRRLKSIESGSTITMMLIGIPNVEKGKLKHVKVSPHPGETKDISSFKIGSHPNIYVLDTPGIFPPQILDAEIYFKLALTGAIQAGLIGYRELAQYFLAVLNLSDEYKKWTMSPTHEKGKSITDNGAESSRDEHQGVEEKKQHLTDHTQDFIVHDVRRKLFETISSFDGDMQNQADLEKLIELQFAALTESFHLPTELGDDVHYKIATKLLNLYRTGRLGHYSLDPLTLRQ